MTDNIIIWVTTEELKRWTHVDDIQLRANLTRRGLDTNQPLYQRVDTKRGLIYFSNAPFGRVEGESPDTIISNNPVTELRPQQPSPSLRPKDPARDPLVSGGGGAKQGIPELPKEPQMRTPSYLSPLGSDWY